MRDGCQNKIEQVEYDGPQMTTPARLVQVNCPPSKKRPLRAARRPFRLGITRYNLPQSVGGGPSRCRFEQSQSAADLDGAYSPTMACHDATPGHIANGLVVVAGVAVGIVKSRAPVTESKATMTETTTMESATAMTSAAAMTSTTMGEDGRAGCTEQDSRSADNAEAANGEQSYRRQTARQDVAIVRAVLGHRYSFRECMHRQIVKIIINNRRFETRHRSNHLNVILTRPDAHR